MNKNHEKYGIDVRYLSKQGNCSILETVDLLWQLVISTERGKEDVRNVGI